MSIVWKAITGKPEPWRWACVRHDRAYWKGGTREDRKWADLTLFRDVRRTGHSWWAAAMYLAVRLGGWPWWPVSWRWGYGWSYGRGYRR